MERHPGYPAFAQIGGGEYEPSFMRFARMLTPQAFAETIAMAKVVVAHAGMGSVIMAAERATPVVLLPRRHALGEHTTDHQMHAMGWLSQRPGVFVAEKEDVLDDAIARALKHVADGERLPEHAPAAFVEKLREAMLR